MGGFRSSPVAYTKIAFRVVGCGFRRLSQSRDCLALDITPMPTIERHTSKQHTFQLLSYAGQILPGSDYRSGSLAFILIREFSSPCPATLRNLCLPDICPPATTCYTPRPVSLSDDRLYISPSFLDILVYRLLKAGFGIHPHGRTMVSFPRAAVSSLSVPGSLPPRNRVLSILPIMVSALSL